VDALVTGGCGFIGRHLVRSLLARGQSVRVLDIAGAHDLPDVEHVHGSVLNAALVAKAMTGVRRVYHLAGIPHLWVARRTDFDRVNARGTEIVLRAAAERRIERVIHCSTESILLPPPGNARSAIDGSELPPEAQMPGPYTRSKHRAERAALAAAAAGLDVVIVNPTLPVGPGDPNFTPPTAMLFHFVNGKSPFFLDCLLNFADVRTVAAGMVLASDFGRTGARYILGGENITLRQLLAVMERELGRPMPKYSIAGPAAFTVAMLMEWNAEFLSGKRPAATREGVRLALRSAPFDARRAKQELGYSPHPVDGAIRETLRWLTATAGVPSGPPRAL
jgi:dihydroflavonol-4-reductase